MIKFTTSLILLVTLLPYALSFGTGCNKFNKRSGTAFPPPTSMPENLKVAFIGDAGNNSNQRKVLELVKNWGAEFIVHSGDFEYADNPSQFEANLNAVLGPDYPYFASIGNHDLLTWEGSSGHKSRLVSRLARFNATNNCVGEYGVNMACNYKGMYFVLSGVGTKGSNHASYIDEAFTNYPAVWKFVSWHKNQKLMQIGSKSDETGWSVYETALKHGAFVATGHEHSYCRSHLMSSFQNQVVVNTSKTINLSQGKSFVFVSGLAGVGIRTWDENLRKNPWWGSVGASNNQIQYGGILCTFNVGGDLRRADCAYQDTNQRVWDQFSLYSNLPASFADNDIKIMQREVDEESFIEIPVSSHDGDVFESLDGTIHCKTEEIELGSGISLYKFEKVPLNKGEKVTLAQLQFFGIESDVDQIQPNYLVSAHIGESRFSCDKESPKFQLRDIDTSFKTLTWTEDVAEEWERSAIWVSSDFSSLINEIVDSEEWTYGSSIHLKLKGQGLQTIKTYDYSPCFAPTLTLEF